ncbi:hypothetical protein BGX29_012322 [Mortierella sp. GBA35]|nr:hypothetical protein BGX29_012322 [Mortierella sp. GBA35]
MRFSKSSTSAVILLSISTFVTILGLLSSAATQAMAASATDAAASPELDRRIYQVRIDSENSESENSQQDEMEVSREPSGLLAEEGKNGYKENEKDEQGGGPEEPLVVPENKLCLDEPDIVSDHQSDIDETGYEDEEADYWKVRAESMGESNIPLLKKPSKLQTHIGFHKIPPKNILYPIPAPPTTKMLLFNFAILGALAVQVLAQKETFGLFSDNICVCKKSQRGDRALFDNCQASCKGAAKFQRMVNTERQPSECWCVYYNIEEDKCKKGNVALAGTICAEADERDVYYITPRDPTEDECSDMC